MKILYATFELSPFTKVGGLADVMGSLPKHIEDKNTQIAIFTPLIGSIDREKYNIIEIENSKLTLNFGTAKYVFTLHMCKLPNTNINVFFIDNPKFFSCFQDVYPIGIDSWYEQERFITFSKAILEYARLLNFKPDIIHCNDWHTSMIPVWLKTSYKNDDFYKNAKTILSIHNLAYQGRYFKEILDFAGINRDEVFHQDGVEQNEILIWLKGAINYADKIITVSPKYAEEILTEEYGEHLEATLNNNKHKLKGILNGIDYEEFNPLKDEHITFKYSFETIQNKEECKKEILKEFNLEYKKDRPLIAIISRLVEQKGFDLIKKVEKQLKNINADIIILGTGEKRYEDYITQLSSKAKNIKVKIEYGKEICNKMYAGADMFLMPSRFEPCGISQLIAMKYGTIPIVRATGGLDNTVTDTTGFKFKNYNAKEMLDCIQKAISTYKNKNEWQNIIKNAMEADFSWNTSAKEYKQVYQSLTNEILK